MKNKEHVERLRKASRRCLERQEAATSVRNKTQEEKREYTLKRALDHLEQLAEDSGNFEATIEARTLLGFGLDFYGAKLLVEDLKRAGLRARVSYCRYMGITKIQVSWKESWASEVLLLIKKLFR